MDQAIQQLIEFLQQASPHVWEVLIRQVYVEVAAKFGWAIGLVVVAVLLSKAATKCKALGDEDDRDWYFAAVFAYVGLGGAVFIAFSLLIGAVMWLINPEFYAIRLILQQLGTE